MTEIKSELLAWVEARIDGTSSQGDLLDIAPELTLDDAYRLQFAMAARRARKGDALIGYKAAYTNVAMQKMYGIPGPTIGSLFKSGLFEQTAPIVAAAGQRISIEPEIAVLLGRDLAGPVVTIADVLRAIEGYIPAMEIAGPPPPPGAPRRSRQTGIAVHKTSGGIVLGDQITAPHGLDLRLEGAVISIGGQPRGSGTGVEVLGNPLTVVGLIANELARFDLHLKAGMVIMTGSVASSVTVDGGDDVLVEFARLGTVRARMA